MIKYKVTIWCKNRAITGYRYLPEGKITAMNHIRPIIERLPKFYFIEGYKVETEKDLGQLIPNELCKNIKH